MSYQYNPIDNSNSNYEELFEVVVRLVDQVVSSSTSGDLGEKALVDIADTDENLQQLTNDSGIDCLITIHQDLENLNNFDPSTRTSYSNKHWQIAHDIYFRIPAERNNKSRLLRIMKEVMQAVCLNESDGTAFTTTLSTDDGWSGKTYSTYLNLNSQLAPFYTQTEPYNENINFYTGILTILFKINQN